MREKIIKAIMENKGYTTIWPENLEKMVQALLKIMKKK